MYLFYFNHDHGRSNALSFAEVTKVKKTSGHYGENLLVVYYDKESGIPGNFQKVPAEEGKIRKRAFWLNDCDITLADDIANDYLKTKWLEQKEKYETMNH